MDDKAIAARIIRDCSGLFEEPENHTKADGILCELLISLGYTETVKAWEAVSKWYE